MRPAFALLLGLWAPVAAFGQLAAFPTAVGQGASASGGRGGDVYHVTTLADYDPGNGEAKIPGSLRHAIRSAQGPRTIVFDVSGVIQLSATLEILKSNLTLAGQTSPGGITLCGYPLEISGAHDVIVRYLRVRTGDFHVPRQAPAGTQAGGLDPGSANAVNVGVGCNRVILDHISASWSIDETLSVTRCRNVTIQHCIIADSLNQSFHPKGAHGYGSLIRAELTPQEQEANEGGFTFFCNLWAHHRARNPSIGGEQTWRGQALGPRGSTDVNLVNNVIYNWGDAPTHRSQGGGVRINLVGNYYINGPEKASKYIFREGDAGNTALYHAGNYHDPDQDADHNGLPVGTFSPDAFQQFDSADQLLGAEQGQPFGFINTVESEILSAENAYNAVVRSVGASLWRDAHDRRVIQSLVERRGAIIDSQEQLRDAAGNLASIDDVAVQRRPPGFDTDGDGMPDEFEKEQGLDPENAEDGNGTQLSQQGFTNLEVYLNGIPSSVME